MSNRNYAYLVCTIILVVLIALLVAFIPKPDEYVSYRVMSIENSNSLFEGDYVTDKNYVVVTCEITNKTEKDIVIKASEIYLSDDEGNKSYLTLFTHSISNGFKREESFTAGQKRSFYFIFETESSSEEKVYYFNLNNYHIGENFPEAVRNPQTKLETIPA